MYRMDAPTHLAKMCSKVAIWPTDRSHLAPPPANLLCSVRETASNRTDWLSGTRGKNGAKAESAWGEGMMYSSRLGQYSPS